LNQSPQKKKKKANECSPFSEPISRGKLPSLGKPKFQKEEKKNWPVEDIFFTPTPQ